MREGEPPCRVCRSRGEEVELELYLLHCPACLAEQRTGADDLSCHRCAEQGRAVELQPAALRCPRCGAVRRHVPRRGTAAQVVGGVVGMIVLVVLAVVAVVAVVAFKRYKDPTELNAERTFVSKIQALQETYYQRFGAYHDVSGNGGRVGALYPPGGTRYESRAWRPDPGGDEHQGWLVLGARPRRGVTRFRWRLETSHPDPDPARDHALYGNARRYGVPPQPATGARHPWYYVEGIADMDPSTPGETVIYTSSGRNDIVTLREGAR